MYEGVQNVQMFENRATRDPLMYRLRGIQMSYTHLIGLIEGGFASLSDESYIVRKSVQNVQRFKKH